DWPSDKFVRRRDNSPHASTRAFSSILPATAASRKLRELPRVRGRGKPYQDLLKLLDGARGSSRNQRPILARSIGAWLRIVMCPPGWWIIQEWKQFSLSACKARDRKS